MEKRFFRLLIEFYAVVNVSCLRNVSVCNTDIDEELLSVMNENGNCEPYIGGNNLSPCDRIYTPGVSYVYILNTRINGMQSVLLDFLENAENFISLVPMNCIDPIANVLCNYYYLPCGFNGTVHVPRVICPYSCTYVSETLCRDVWEQIQNIILYHVTTDPFYTKDETLYTPVCNETDKYSSFLNLSNDCCTDGGIVIPPTVLPPTSNYLSSWQISIIVVSIIILDILLVSVLLCTIAIICRKRQANILLTRTSSTKMDAHPELSKNKNSIRYCNNIIQNYTDQCKDIEHSIVSDEYVQQLSKCIIPVNKLQLLETVGQGEFGIVYRGILTCDDNPPIPVAVKTLKGVFSDDDIESFKQESLKMSFFDHNNVLSLIGVCIDTGPAPYIVMPFMSNGCLLSYLKKERARLTIASGCDEDLILNTRKQLLSICLQVANGMAYLAEHKFVHRDLAARNCMIDSNGIIKVCDFGMTENIYNRNYYRQLKNNGTIKLPLKWMALESLHDGIFSEKTDVWSYGVLCWEIFTLGKIPYPGLDPAGVIELLEGGGRLRCPTNAACSDEVYLMMCSCWSQSTDDRPTFYDISQTINDLMKPLANYLVLS